MATATSVGGGGPCCEDAKTLQRKALVAEVALASHSGVVFLDTDVHGRQILTHTTTLERQVLRSEGGPWALVMGEDGFACLVQESGATVLVEDQLQLQLYEQPGGHMVVMDRSGPTCTTWSMTEKLREYRSGEVSWKFGHCQTNKLPMCVVTVPRGGCRFFLSAPEMYRRLGLNSYKGCPSKWVYESVPAWRVHLATMGIDSWLLHSPAGETVLVALNSTTHFLPWIGVSTIAFVSVLVRKAHPISQRGGAPDAVIRRQCQEILDGLLISVASDIGDMVAWELKLTWLFSWVSHWPRPNPHAPDITLSVFADGTIDLGPWHDVVKRMAPRSASPARKWYGMIEHLGPRCSLAQVLLAVGHAPASSRATGLLAQLLVQTASRIEKFMQRTVKGAVGIGDCALEAFLHDAADMVQTPRDVDMLLIRHVESSKQLLHGQQYISLSTDKAWVKGLNLVNSIIATPSNVACVCPPQVDEAYQPSLESETAVTTQQKEAVAEEQNARHQAWIERSKPGGDSTSTSFRRRKMFRLSAMKVLRALDNQVRVMMHPEGLKRFFFDGEKDIWKDYTKWPHVTITTDRGSDNHSAMYAISYYAPVQLNCSIWWDPSHDGWRSVLEAIRETGLYGFTLLLMIVCNLAHGPDGTDMRFGQLRAASQDLFRNHTSTSCKLYHMYTADLLKEAGSSLPQVDGEAVEETLWQSLHHLSVFSPKGYRANLNRFQSFVREGKGLLTRWYATLFIVEFAALELGMLTEQTLKTKLRLHSGCADADAPSGSTSATQVSDRIIRNVAQNAVAISFLTLQERRHHRIMSIIVGVASPVERWHGTQNHALRAAESSVTWAVRQIASEYMAHVSDVMEALAQEELIMQAGFGTPGGEQSKYKWSPEDIMAEDDFAALLGNMTLNLVVARLRRFLPQLCSWPWGMARLLHPAADGDSIVQTLRKDYEDFKAFAALAAPPRAVKDLVARSVFQTLSVKQLVHACDASGWRASPELVDMMKKRLAGLLGTQIVEDVHNVQKNSRSVSGGATGAQHFRRPETSFVNCITRGVVDKIHRFKRPEIKTAVVRRSAVLEQSCFKSSHSSLPFQRVASPKQQPEYWSPSPGSSATTAVDHELCRAALGAPSSISEAWLGSWCEARHRICFRREQDPPHQWWIALCHFERSACMVWPATLERQCFTGGHIHVVMSRTDQPHIMPILNLHGIIGFVYEWKSWAWQREFATLGVRPAVRAFRFQNTVEEDILRVCARQAWFNMARPRIVDFMLHDGHAKPSSDSLFDVCFAASRAILGTSDSETMDIMKVRFSNLRCHTEYMGNLLEVDEAQACLDENDRSELKRVQAAVVEHLAERREFVRGFRSQRERMGSSTTGARGSKRARLSALADWKGPRKLPQPGKESLLQKDLRLYAPPGGYIWVSRGSRAWCTRLPPLRQFSAYWKNYSSEEAAARAALQDLWSKYLEVEGLDATDCPISNLCLDAAQPSSAASSSQAVAEH